MAAEGAEVAAAAEVAGVADAEPVVEAAASRGELAAGARADRFPITLKKANSSRPGRAKSTRPMHVLPGRQAVAWISSDDGRTTDLPYFQEACPNRKRQFHFFENAWARKPGKLHALIS